VGCRAGNDAAGEDGVTLSIWNKPVGRLRGPMREGADVAHRRANRTTALMGRACADYMARRGFKKVLWACP